MRSMALWITTALVFVAAACWVFTAAIIGIGVGLRHMFMALARRIAPEIQ